MLGPSLEAQCLNLGVEPVRFRLGLEILVLGGLETLVLGDLEILVLSLSLV